MSLSGEKCAVAPTAAPTVAPAPLSSSNGNTKRHYSAWTSSADFLEAFHLSTIQAKEAQQEEREEQKEDRKILMAAITAAVSGLATVFGNQHWNKSTATTSKRKVQTQLTWRQQHVADSSDSSVNLIVLCQSQL